jgi:hypothetical protein
MIKLIFSTEKIDSPIEAIAPQAGTAAPSFKIDPEDESVISYLSFLS